MKDLFPILKTELNHQPLVYLDNAATMQMPKSVMDAMSNFYQSSNANIHRGIHNMSESATLQYEAVREKVRRFIDAGHAEEIVFTSGTTASINMVAQMLEAHIQPGDRILLTEMEHHSNLLPWREMASRKGAIVDVIPVLSDGTLDMEAFLRMITLETKVVSFTEVSNVSGIRNPVKEMIETIRDNSNAWILVDGAQGLVHDRNSVREMGCDFYAFSGHKLGAPTGTGVLYIKRECMTALHPTFFGGGTVHAVSKDEIHYVDGPSLFEPGTPNYAGIIGFGYTIDFWLEQEREHDPEVVKQKILSGNMHYRDIDILNELDSLPKREANLLSYLEMELSHIPEIQVLGFGKKHYGCISFAAEGIHPYDIARMLNNCNIAVRSGHMCAQPYIEALGYTHVVRVSVAPYNTMADIEKFVDCLTQIIAEMKVLSKQKDGDNQLWENQNSTMEEVEEAILQRMNACMDASERLRLLSEYATNCLEAPGTYRHDVYELVECQVDAVVLTGWVGDKRSIFVDSSSTLIKGVLAILQKIYMGRTEAEMKSFRCSILESPFMEDSLAKKQLEVMHKVMKAIIG